MNAMMQWLSRVERRRLAAWAIGLAVILFLALNTFGHLGLRQWRLDLTGNRQFTLSDGTRHLLGSMKEPVTLRLYASSSLREANPFLGAESPTFPEEKSQSSTRHVARSESVLAIITISTANFQSSP